MALSVVAASTIVHGTTSCAPTYPAGIQADDVILMGVGLSPHTTASFPTISGWTKIREVVLGGGTLGAGTGPRRLCVYQKDVVAGTETGSVTVTPSAASNVCSGSMIALRCAASKLIDILDEQGEDTAAGSAASATAGSVLAETAADLMLGWIVAPTNSNLSSQTFSATGATYGTVVEHVDGGTTNGDDIRVSWVSRPISSGTASAATVYTTSATPTLGVIFLRLREVDAATEYTDSGTAILALTPSALEERQQFDADMVLLALTASGTEIQAKEYTDSATASVLLTASGTELQATEYVDTATALLAFTVSALEERQQYDSATVPLLFTPSGQEEKQQYDADTGLVILTPSAQEERQQFDSDTVPLLLTPSGSDEYTPGVGGTEYIDSGTALLALTPTTVDITEFVDSASVSLLFTVSAVELQEVVDQEISLVRFIPSATEAFGWQDQSTALVQLTPSSVEEYTVFDTATVPLKFTPFDIVSGVDTGTAILRLVPATVVEVYYLFDTLLEATISRVWDATYFSHWSASYMQKWAASLVGNKWSATLQERTWNAGLAARNWSAAMLRNWAASYFGRGD